MNNIIKKVMFLFIFGLFVFLIDISGAYAFTNNQIACSYSGDWGTVEFKVKTKNGNTYYLVTERTDNGDCDDDSGGCLDIRFNGMKGLLTHRLDPVLYDLHSDTTTGEYKCPTLYWKIGKFDDASQVDTYNFDVSNTEGATSVSSNINPEKLTSADIKTTCDATKIKEFDNLVNERKKDLSNKYSEGYSYASNINVDREQAASEIQTCPTNATSKILSEYNDILEKLEKFTVDNNCRPDHYSDVIREIEQDFVDKKNSIIQACYAKQKELEDKNVVDEEKADYILEQMQENEERTTKKIYEINKQYGHIVDVSIDVNDSPVTCEGLLGDDVLDDIREIFTWIKIAAPILVIVLGALDFTKAVLISDDKALNKAVSTFIKRCIAAVALFLAPFIIMFILERFNEITETSGGCDIKEITGAIIRWKI